MVLRAACAERPSGEGPAGDLSMTSDDRKIPFNQPKLHGSELEYIRQTVQAMHTAGDGPFTRKCVDLLRQELGSPGVMLTTSCTDALEMSALLLDIRQGDEVIVPSFTFVSSVNSFVMRGAKPVFCDIRPDTLNIDETLIESLISPRTKALVLVHYGGVGCEMDAIMEIAERRGIAVVEDNAHGLFSRYRGRYLGTFGCLSTNSFHETKNIMCGEGGALIINDPSLVERAEIIRDKGTNRQQLFRGEVDKYTWVDVGSSYVLSDILAAFLYAQLEAREKIAQRRRELWNDYDAQLREWAHPLGIATPTVPPHCEQGFHVYYLILRSLSQRLGLASHLRERGIHAEFHYTPLHQSAMGRKLVPEEIPCPVTERVSDCLLRLPFHTGLTREDQDRVVSEIKRWGEAGCPSE